MFEFVGRKVASVAGAGLMSALLISACSNTKSENTPVSPINTSTNSSLPPLAKPGEVFSCTMDTSPKTLKEAGLTNAAVTISTYFHQTAQEIKANARFGLATCQRSMTASMLQEAGIIVNVPNINPDYTCVTWQAEYKNQTAAEIDGPTNFIGLICVQVSAQNHTQA